MCFSVGEEVEKFNFAFVCVNVKWCIRNGKQYWGSLEIKNQTIVWASNSISVYSSKGIKNSISKMCLNSNTHYSTIHNNDNLFKNNLISVNRRKALKIKYTYIWCKMIPLSEEGNPTSFISVSTQGTLSSPT